MPVYQINCLTSLEKKNMLIQDNVLVQDPFTVVRFLEEKCPDLTQIRLMSVYKT